jgi:hypothetical protein
MIWLMGCTGSNTVPAGIIPLRTMETVTWQLMQSDEYVNTLLLKDSLKKASVEKMKIYRQVCDLNGVSLDAFKKSYLYYMDHPDMAKTMFDSISAKASRQRADMYKPAPAIVAPVPVKPGLRPDTARPSALTLPGNTIISRQKKFKPTLSVKAARRAKRGRIHKPL